MVYIYCMRISAESRFESRTRWQHYKSKSGGTDDFTSNVVFLEDVFFALRKQCGLPLATQDEVVAYIDRVCETKGIALPPGAPWEPVNVRGPYKNTIPGMISEMIASYNLFPKYRTIEHPQLKEIQFVQAIDIFAGDMSFQVKSVQFKGHELLIDADWVKGIPDCICLVDIDDQVHYCIPREELEKWVGTILLTRQLEDMSLHHWNNNKKYPKRG